MKKYIFYLYKGDTYYDDRKKFSFVSVKNPEFLISYISMDPDELEEFKEIEPSSQSKPYRSAAEKLFRNMTDLSSVIYLTQETFVNLMRQLNNYLQEIEDYERMCVLRDVTELYYVENSKKKSEIEDYIKHFNKLNK
jgi:hypothetical protein